MSLSRAFPFCLSSNLNLRFTRTARRRRRRRDALFIFQPVHGVFYVSYAFVPRVIKTFWPESTDGGPLRFKHVRKFILLPHSRRAPRGARDKVRVRRALVIEKRRRIAQLTSFARVTYSHREPLRVRGSFVWQALASYVGRARLFDPQMIVTIF